MPRPNSHYLAFIWLFIALGIIAVAVGKVWEW